MQCIIFFLFLALFGCQKETKGEYIFRKSHEYFHTPPPSFPLKRPPYPWEMQEVGGHPRITKEFFRCKGNPLNPPVEKKRESKASVYFYDCLGSHGLPLVDGEEFVYPILIDLLNYIQQETQKKVTITTGHRCPTHNTYADYSSYNFGSKHMIGAEVDFYVEGVDPLQLVEILQSYYEAPFLRYTKGNLNVSTEPWYNEEIFIKLYLAHEGRDKDNEHSYPYLSIQVRYDKSRQERVVFTGDQSDNYLRG